MLFPGLQEAMAQNPARIMLLGDSLTSSIGGQASYRYWLWKKLEASGYNVDFVGSLWGVADGESALYPDFDQDHEGHPSATTNDILYGIGSWASWSRPDVVLMLVGATDFEEDVSAPDALTNSVEIINVLREVNPNIAILWAMVPPAPDQSSSQTKAYNRGVSRYARALSQPASPIRVVNLWSGYSPRRDTVDGEHPNASGERKFASRFYSQLTRVLRWLGQVPSRR
jgi:lysophospholipase L1-like esterase